MKYRIMTGLIFLVIVIGSLVTYSYEQLSPSMAEFKELSFKVGAIYAIKAQADPRYNDCRTTGDLADLAWTKYQEDESNDQRKK